MSLGDSVSNRVDDLIHLIQRATKVDSFYSIGSGVVVKMVRFTEENFWAIPLELKQVTNGRVFRDQFNSVSYKFFFIFNPFGGMVNSWVIYRRCSRGIVSGEDASASAGGEEEKEQEEGGIGQAQSVPHDTHRWRALTQDAHQGETREVNSPRSTSGTEW